MPTYVGLGYSGATTKGHCIYGRPPVFLRFDKYTQTMTINSVGVKTNSSSLTVAKRCRIGWQAVAEA